MRKILLLAILIFCLAVTSYAAPCYGTKMPRKKEFSAGLQTHSIFKRYLEDAYGTLRSTQHFFLISYGVYGWLCIDLKGGVGNIKQHPVGISEIDYSYGFAGGYGFRIKLYEKEKINLVIGFQHISVHPRSEHLSGIHNKAVLDDWQASFLLSRDFGEITPYLGVKGSRTDYIHWQEESRKRKMSDLTKDVGLVVGVDLPITDKIWSNIEAQFLDVAAVACSLNFKF